MEILERPAFESADGKRIYKYVERHGRTDAATVRDAVGISAATFREELDRLESAGYLTEADGTLALALDVGTEQTYERDGVTYVVRPARDEDFEGLVGLIGDVVASGTYAVGEELAQELRYEDTVTRHNNVWSRVFFVATVGDYPVGWTHLDLPQVDKLRRIARLTVGVREEYRGHGVGTRLLNRGLAWASDSGYRKVYNSVAATNAGAIEFLENRGWEVEARRADHFTVGGEQVDEVMLAYWIESS